MRLECALEGIEQTAGGWNLQWRTPVGKKVSEHAAVLLTVPAYHLAKLPFESNLRVSLDFLKQIRYAPVSSVVLGFRREQVKHPLDGFGFLVPEVERLNVLGAIFSSSLFPNRAPSNHVLITCYLGGFRAPDLPFRDVSEQVKLVRQDLEKTLGVTGEPVFAHHALYRKAIPQYELGYAAVRRELEAVEIKCPGLFFGGNYRNGVSLSDSLLNGFALGERLNEYSRTDGRVSFEPVLAAA
jgi:oxygen-dependent protoporphyrinogen oxidase